MEFSDFTIRLIIILIPGAIATLIIESITIHKSWSHLRFTVSSIILGGTSFGILQLLYWGFQLYQSRCIDIKFENLQTWKSIFKNENALNPIEIILSVLISIALSYCVSYIIQHKILFKIAKRFNVSRKYGDDSLYSHYLNADEVDWVYVRDKTNGMTYLGQVDSWSEDDSNKELLLRNVTVFKYENSDELYKIKQIYLKFHERDIIIELPEY